MVNNKQEQLTSDAIAMIKNKKSEIPKKVVVFGANGGTGYWLTVESLARNLDVTAAFRNPEAFEKKISPVKSIVQHEKLTPLEFNIEKNDSVVKAIQGKDVIFISVGQPLKLFGKVDVVHEPLAKALVTALETLQKENQPLPKKLVALSSVGLCPYDENRASGASYFTLAFVAMIKRGAKGVYDDVREMEGILLKELPKFNIELAIVRPPGLTDGAMTGKYRTSPGKMVENTGFVSRADLADYMIDLALEEKSTNQFYYISE